MLTVLTVSFSERDLQSPIQQPESIVLQLPCESVYLQASQYSHQNLTLTIRS